MVVVVPQPDHRPGRVVFVADGAEADARAAELRQTFIGVSLKMGPLTVRRESLTTNLGIGLWASDRSGTAAATD